MDIVRYLQELKLELSPEYLCKRYMKPKGIAAIFDHAYILTTREFRADVIQKHAFKYGVTFEGTCRILNRNSTLEEPSIPLRFQSLILLPRVKSVLSMERHLLVWKGCMVEREASIRHSPWRATFVHLRKSQLPGRTSSMVQGAAVVQSKYFEGSHLQ